MNVHTACERAPAWQELAHPRAVPAPILATAAYRNAQRTY
jgi:hypothetical protein